MVLSPRLTSTLLIRIRIRISFPGQVCAHTYKRADAVISAPCELTHSPKNNFQNMNRNRLPTRTLHKDNHKHLTIMCMQNIMYIYKPNNLSMYSNESKEASCNLTEGEKKKSPTAKNKTCLLCEACEDDLLARLF